MTSSATPTSSSSTFDRLAAQGYVVLRQFLAPAECAELRAMYARLPPSVDGIGLNVRYLTLPPSIVRRVHVELLQTSSKSYWHSLPLPQRSACSSAKVPPLSSSLALQPSYRFP